MTRNERSSRYMKIRCMPVFICSMLLCVATLIWTPRKCVPAAPASHVVSLPSCAPVACESQASELDRLKRLTSKAATIGNPQTRDAWIREFAGKIPPGSTVLDVSAGARPYKELWSHCDYRSHEFPGNAQLVDGFRGESKAKTASELKAMHNYVGDITNTTAPSDYFDVVMLTEVLEHVPEPLSAIKELARVAKPGGHIIVSAPFTSGSHQLPFHFSSGYSREFYHHAAGLFALNVTEIISQGDYFKLMAQELGRVLTCGGLVSNASQADVDRIHAVLSRYFLQLSAKSGDFSQAPASCANEFTIGWIVHFTKHVT